MGCSSCSGRGGFWRPNSNGTQDFVTCVVFVGRPPRDGGGADPVVQLDPTTSRNTVMIVLLTLLVVFVVFPGIAVLVLMSKLSQVACAVTGGC